MGAIEQFNNLRSTVVLIIVAVIILVIGILGCFFIIRYFRKKDEAEKGKTEDGSTYRDVRYAQAEDFVPIDDIADGMVIEDGFSRFTAVLKTSGTDFYNLGQTEQIQIQNGYEGFIKAVKDPWSFYYLAENVDMESVKNSLNRCIAGIEDSLFAASERYKVLRAEYDRAKAHNLPVKSEVTDEMIRLQSRISGFQVRLKEAQAELAYAETFDSPDRVVEKSALVYAFTWHYNPGPLGKKYEGQALLDKANNELDRITGQYIALLRSAGVTARRMTTAEIIELCYAHTHPITCGQWKLSNYFAHQVADDDIVRTHSVAQKRKGWLDSLVNRLMFSKRG